MKIQTGTTFIYKREIILEYDCSRCGSHTTGKSILKESIFTSPLVQVDNPRAEADKAFDWSVNQLNKGPVPDRYLGNNHYCRCKNCGNVEPWSVVNTERVKLTLLWLPLILTFFAAININAIPYGMPKLLVGLAGVIPYFAVVIKRANYRKKKLKEIAALPPQSLPVVTSVYVSPAAHLFPFGMNF